MTYYYYNEKEKCFAVINDFKYSIVPDGFVEITEEQYLEMNKENDDNQ